jgi:catechol 2,3-dioxygenase-like lactoylglutathione lyase family enzyme
MSKLTNGKIGSKDTGVMDANSKTSGIRMEGVTLTVKDVNRSVEFYTMKLGFSCPWNAAPAFALIRVGGTTGGTIGLLSIDEAMKEGVKESTPEQKRAIHVELSTDYLDDVYAELLAKGVEFHQPPHDEEWERAATAFDPDGYAIEIAQGRRGQKK